MTVFLSPARLVAGFKQADLQINTELSWMLDYIRALAAFLVVIGHSYDVVFSNSLADKSLAEYSFFAINGAGHTAVVMFFVMSGFLIGKKSIECILLKNKSIYEYSIDRATRLLIVLVPALCLGGLIDYALITTIPETRADSVSWIYDRLNIASFLGSMVGLQTVTTTVFGSNNPLWSLANETWYYILFPLMLLSISSRKWWAHIAVFAGLIAFLWINNFEIVKYILPWLLGAGIWLLPTSSRDNSILLIPILAILLYFSSFSMLSISGVGFTHVLLSAICVALLINNYRKTSLTVPKIRFFRFLSHSSYTLYLVHFPLTIFVKYMLSTHYEMNRNYIDGTGIAIWAGLILASYIYSIFIYHLFEKHYHVFRKFTYRMLLKY